MLVLMRRSSFWGVWEGERPDQRYPAFMAHATARRRNGSCRSGVDFAPALREAAFVHSVRIFRLQKITRQLRSAGFYGDHTQANITRDSVAAYFRLSSNHISRLFKKEGAISFNDYVNYTRVNRAKALLREYRQSVDEVATACGYSEASYFCRVLKKFTKTTPSAYRQRPVASATLKVNTIYRAL